jgi:hypothetical protein
MAEMAAGNPEVIRLTVVPYPPSWQPTGSIRIASSLWSERYFLLSLSYVYLAVRAR